MNKLLTNDKFKYFLRCSVALVMLSILILEMQRHWTNTPGYTLYINADSVQGKLARGTSIGDYLHEWSTFAYFTTWSNIVFVLPFTVIALLNIKVPTRFKMMFTTYLTITFFVFWTSLAPFLPWGQSSYFDFISIYEHCIPFFICIVWSFANRTEAIKKEKSSYLYMMILPIVYLVFIIIFSIAIKFDVSVYPFLNFKNWFGLDLSIGVSVLMSIISIGVCALIFIFTFWLVVFIFNRILVKKSI